MPFSPGLPPPSNNQKSVAFFVPSPFKQPKMGTVSLPLSPRLPPPSNQKSVPFFVPSPPKQPKMGTVSVPLAPGLLPPFKQTKMRVSALFSAGADRLRCLVQFLVSRQEHACVSYANKVAQVCRAVCANHNSLWSSPCQSQFHICFGFAECYMPLLSAPLFRAVSTEAAEQLSPAHQTGTDFGLFFFWVVSGGASRRRDNRLLAVLFPISEAFYHLPSVAMWLIPRITQASVCVCVCACVRSSTETPQQSCNSYRTQRTTQMMISRSRGPCVTSCSRRRLSRIRFSAAGLERVGVRTHV